MQSATLIILLTFVGQANSKELFSNHTGDVEDPMAKLADKLVDKLFETLVDKLLDGVLKVQSVQQADLDKTELALPSFRTHPLQRSFPSPSWRFPPSLSTHLHFTSGDFPLPYQLQFSHRRRPAEHMHKAAQGAQEHRVPASQDAASRRAAVIGAGPAGLLTAIMLAQRGWQQISVFDSLTAPPLPDDKVWGVGERSYQLGLNGRGQSALRKFGAMERVDSYSAQTHGRLSFDTKTGSPEEDRWGDERTYVGRVLQRDRLQSCLIEEIKEQYPQVSIKFGVACEGVDLGGDLPAIRLCTPAGVNKEMQPEECEVGTIQEPLSFDLVVGADGVRSAVRESLSEVEGSTTRTVRFPDNNERRYKSLMLHPSAVPGTAADLNWSGGNKTLNLQMEALPTKEGEMVGVLLLRPGSPIYNQIEDLKSSEQARALFEQAMPSIVPYLRDDDLEKFVKRPISKFPTFQLVEGDIHYSMPHGGVVMLGDAIKAVKPYFGQGANSALEDVSALNQCLEQSSDNPAKAVAAFSRARAELARELVRTSRSFDRPGPLGTARFVLPLIIDSILNRMLPAFFTPPILRGMQDGSKTLIQLRKRKSAERALLVVLLSGLVTGVLKLLALMSFALRRSLMPV